MSKAIVALDFSSKEQVIDFLNQFEEPIYVKIGMELTYACGLDIVKTVKEMGHHIFLDLKLHDIPNTVKGGMKNLAKLGVDIVNVHCAGGIAMIAHPAGYFKGMNEKRMDEILEALPLDGIECAHPSVPEENTNFYRAYCRKHKLLSSGGTDCHEDPPHAYLKLSPGRDMAHHAGAPEWLDEILERVRLRNV